MKSLDSLITGGTVLLGISCLLLAVYGSTIDEGSFRVLLRWLTAGGLVLVGGLSLLLLYNRTR